MWFRSLSVCLLTLLTFISTASAAGFHIREQGAKAMGMGNAFAAQADDPTAIFFNPAGLAFQDGTQVSAGITTIFIPEANFTGTVGSGTTVISEDANSDVFFPPNLYASHRFEGTPWALGLGITSQYPLAKNWDDNGNFRTVVQEISIKPVNVNPTVAYRFSDLNLAVGGGIDYTYAWVEKRRRDAFDLGQADLEGQGDGWGFNLGLLWKPTDWISVGVAYRSQIHIDITGDLNRTQLGGALPSFTADAETEVTLPETFSFAVAVKPTEKLTLEFDADRFGWSSYEALDIFYSNFSVAAAASVYPFRNASTGDPFGTELTAKDWKDVWAFRFGAEYALNETWDLRAGYAYDNNPAPDSTVAPDLPDSDRHNFTVGFGYNQDWGSIDVAYMYVLFKDRNVSNSVQAGKYEADVHLVGANVTFKF